MQNSKGKDLSTSALQIYICLLKKNPEPTTFSEIKEYLGLPKSTIHYNLDRLKKEQLIEETPNGYIVKQFEQLEALKHYISVFGKILPRYVLFSVFFFLMTIAFLITELVPQIKFILAVLSILGFCWTVALAYKYRL